MELSHPQVLRTPLNPPLADRLRATRVRLAGALRRAQRIAEFRVKVDRHGRAVIRSVETVRELLRKAGRGDATR